MYDKYTSYFGKNQVINNNVVNITINNYVFHQETERERKPDSEREAEETEFSQKRCKNKIDWDLAEDFEENINDLKEKYLPSKLKTLKLEDIYVYLKNYSVAERLHQCGAYLEFTIKRDETIDKKKFKRSYFCKRRLCPFCAWRRSLRIFSNVLRCYNYITRLDFRKDNNEKSRFILITLTTENILGENLRKEVDDILKGFKRLSDYKRFKDAFNGYVRSLEITHDREPLITEQMYDRKKDYYLRRGLHIGDKNPNYLYFNVHIHVLCHTTYKKYQDNYIDQKEKHELSKLWQKAMKINYEPVVDIRSFRARSKETKGRELAEIAKYTVKPTDYLKSDYKEKRRKKEDFDSEFVLDVKAICYLDEALAGRRLFAYGGSFKEAHKKLKLDDENLLDDKDLGVGEEYILKYYFDFDLKKYKHFG